MKRRNFDIVAMLDDLLLVCKTREQCFEGLVVLVNLLRSLGFNISWKKMTEISQFVTFLGVNLDSVKFELSLPADKLSNIRDMLESFSVKKRAFKRQLSKLAGKIGFLVYTINNACRVFMQSIFDLMRDLKAYSHKAVLNDVFRNDVRLFKCV